MSGRRRAAAAKRGDSKRGEKKSGSGAAAAKRAPEDAADRLRIDKWLWRARFYKTRGEASAAVEAGKIRVNGARQTKPGAALKTGDVLTIGKAGRVFVVELIEFGERRGPAAEARTLYRDLTTPPAEAVEPGADARPDSDAPSLAAAARKD